MNNEEFLDKIGFTHADRRYRGWFAKLRKRLSLLERIITDTELTDDLLAILDGKHYIVVSIDKEGKLNAPCGANIGRLLTALNAQVDGEVNISEITVRQDTEAGMFYVVDKNDYVLLEIDANGNLNHKGIPSDVQAALTALSDRITALGG